MACQSLIWQAQNGQPDHVLSHLAIVYRQLLLMCPVWSGHN